MGVEPRDAGKRKTGMDTRTEDELAAVSIATKPARDIRARWSWVEPESWTDRMLTALEQGAKGGPWCSFRWTYAFFAEHELFSLCATRVSVRQSLCNVTR
jgi:hypothetical protein